MHIILFGKTKPIFSRFYNGLFLIGRKAGAEIASRSCHIHPLGGPRGHETTRWREAGINRSRPPASSGSRKPGCGPPAKPRAEFIDEHGGGSGVRLRKHTSK